MACGFFRWQIQRLIEPLPVKVHWDWVNQSEQTLSNSCRIKPRYTKSNQMTKRKEKKKTTVPNEKRLRGKRFVYAAPGIEEAATPGDK